MFRPASARLEHFHQLLAESPAHGDGKLAPVQDNFEAIPVALIQTPDVIQIHNVGTVTLQEHAGG